MTLCRTSTRTPVGTLTLVASGKGLSAVLWEDDDPMRVRLGSIEEDGENPLLIETEAQLHAYFGGTLDRFSIPLDPRGTPFQHDVWSALRAIPFGETRSYGAIARTIGRPAASRAVGAGNARNPLSIVTPCHRVIGSGGALTGFAGGLAVKERLLAHEREVRARR